MVNLVIKINDTWVWLHSHNLQINQSLNNILQKARNRFYSPVCTIDIWDGKDMTNISHISLNKFLQKKSKSFNNTKHAFWTPSCIFFFRRWICNRKAKLNHLSSMSLHWSLWDHKCLSCFLENKSSPMSNIYVQSKEEKQSQELVFFFLGHGFMITTDVWNTRQFANWSENFYEMINMTTMIVIMRWP